MDHSVRLTDDELLVLDGKCSAKVQDLVNEVKVARSIGQEVGITSNDAAFIASALAEAEKNLKLTHYGRSFRSCNVCERYAGYAKFRSGPRRGRDNEKRPLSFQGVELADRSVSVSGYSHIGCCDQCWARIQPVLAERLNGVRAEVHERITGKPTAWIRKRKAACRCGWIGNEGDLGMLPAMMLGEYPGQCPACGAKNMPLARDNPVTFPGGFDLVSTSRSCRNR